MDRRSSTARRARSAPWWTATALAAATALAHVSAQGGAGGTPERVLPPTYPWITEPIDAIYGHLSEGAFQEPLGVWFEPSARELFVADSRNGLIGIYDDGRIPLFAFGGPAKLLEPRAVVARPDGTIYVLDAQQDLVHAFDFRGEALAPLRFARPPRQLEEAPPDKYAKKDGEPATPKPPEKLHPDLRIGAFALDAQGRWYVGDLEEGRVLVYDREQHFLKELEASPRAKKFKVPVDVAVSASGLVAVADMQTTPAIHVYDAEGRLMAAFGERDIGLKDFTAPIAVTFDEQDYVYALDLLRHDVKVFTPKGDFVHHFGGWSTPETRGRAPGELLYPVDISIDPQGTIYIAERFGQRVQAFARKPKPEPERRGATKPKSGDAEPVTK